MSVLRRFRERKLGPVTVEVPWPVEKPELIFQVNRFAQAEHISSQFDTEKLLKERAIEKPDERTSEEEQKTYTWQTVFCSGYCLSKYVQRHIKSWKFVGEGEDVPFSSGSLETLFAEMGFYEKAGVGLAYLQAIQGAEQGKDPKDQATKATPS